MVLRICLMVLLFLPQVLAGGTEYASSLLYCWPTQSGNVAIFQSKYPSPERAAEGGLSGVEAELYLVNEDRLIPFFSRDGQNVVPDPSFLSLQEEGSPTAIGYLLHLSLIHI